MEYFKLYNKCKVFIKENLVEICIRIQRFDKIEIMHR